MTIADFAVRVLQHLGELEAEETPDSADNTLIIQVYTDTVNELAELGIVYWSATDSIPDAYVRPMVAIVAANAGHEFMVPDLDRRLVLKEAAMNTIRRMAGGRFNPEVVKVEYF